MLRKLAAVQSLPHSNLKSVSHLFLSLNQPRFERTNFQALLRLSNNCPTLLWLFSMWLILRFFTAKSQFLSTLLSHGGK